MSEYVIMENPTENKIRHIAEYGYSKILKMQNLSLKDLERIVEMNDFTVDNLKQLAIARHIKNYDDMSKEDLLIALLKSNKRHTELRKSEYNNKEIQENEKLFNELRNNFSQEKIKRIKMNILKASRIKMLICERTPEY